MRTSVLLILTLLARLTFGQQVITYNFENADITGWTQKPQNRWDVTTSTPISGSASLKHSFDNPVAYTDTIYTELPAWDIDKGEVTWQILVRHGYDPSASNSWWVYLMTDENLSTTGESGYAVGVNLTGSDDLLKIWRVDNGSPQVILSSSLNWQTQIGTGKPGAIEVTRTFDGLFTLKASPLGNFNTLVVFGSTPDATYKTFSHFGVGYRYSSAQDMKLWVDDISFIYQPINPNDRTTKVVAPLQQVQGADIPSTSAQNNVDVFRFVISDAGSGDGLPTYVKRITVKNPDPENNAWGSLIGDVRLKKNALDIQAEALSVTDQQITLEVDSAALTIPDGQNVELTLTISLKNDNLPDNVGLSFYIDNENHGFLSSLWGSGFSNTFPAKVQSELFTVRVTATNTLFRSISPVTIIGKPFGLEVAATDERGNVDADYTGQLTVSLYEGAGNLNSSNGFARTAVKGIAKWDSLIYNRYGIIRLKATGDNLIPSISEDITIGYDTSSFAAVPGTQVPSFDVSSMATSPAQAFEIMRFRITDNGSDGAPTYLGKIRLYRANTVNAASLSKVVEGVLVREGTSYISTSTIDIKTSTIDILFPLGAITIPDGQTRELSIWLYLKSKDITDNQTLQLYIDKTNPMFLAYDNGSRFATKFPTNVNSATASISVNATKLTFTSTPLQVGVNESFIVKVNPTDANGNTDVNFNGGVELMLGAGNGELNILSENPTAITNGEAQFEVSYTQPGIFTLIARNSGLNDAVSANITCADADGTAEPLIQPTDTVVFTPANSYLAAAQEVIRFKLKDEGGSDGLPLNVSRIKLQAFNPDDIPLLARMLQGIVLDNGRETTTPKSFSFSGNTLQVDFASETLLVEDGDSANIILKAFFWDKGLIDRFKFQFYIPANSPGWSTYENSTAFSNSFPATIFGRPCRVNVDADRLKFLNQPFSVTPNQPFSVSVMACDARGNVDSEFQAYAALELQQGTGDVLVNPVLQSLNNGKASWDNVKFTEVGTYQLKSYFGWLTDAISEPIYCGTSSSCQVNENFEGSLPQWIGIENWVTSRVSPIGGEYSLAHAGDPAAKLSVLSIPILSTLAGKAVEWNITIRNGNWDPSSENYFYLAFASTMENPNDSQAEGYAVGINPSSGNDLLSVWRFSKGRRTNLIKTGFDWNENDEVKISVTLSPKGLLRLWYEPKSSGLKTLGGEVKISPPACSYMALVFGYTASRAGLLWLDDLNFCTTDFPPVITSAKVVNLNALRVGFSKTITTQTALNKMNYRLKTENKTDVRIWEIKNIDSQTVTLVTEKLPFSKLTLLVDKITDVNGYSLPDSIEIGFTAQGNFGRLVINEIMANPTPSNGLPEYEYIELFNPSPDTILTSGWSMTLNDKRVSFPSDTIPPKSYALVGSTSAMAVFKSYGKAIAVTSFPSFLNDGMLIKLFGPEGNLVAFANYTKEWYNDSTRNAGGYSMECIDYQNFAEGKNNWRASVASEGGTPCAPNSVAATNPDITKPWLVYVEVADAQTISLKFNEPMDSLSVMLKENYNTQLQIDEVAVSGLFDLATIKLLHPLRPDQTYEITLSGLNDFAGNALPDTLIRIGLPQNAQKGDIVINEILFNPYTGGTDFVEFYNNSTKCFDLTQLKLGNRDEASLALKEVYSVSSVPRILFPGEYAVVTVNPGQVTSFYTCLNPQAFVRTPRMAAFNNDKGYAVLLNSDNEVIDEFRYTEKMHNRLLTSFKGVSLERINPNAPSNQVSTWQSAAQAAGFATPTYQNSQYSEQHEGKGYFSLTPKTFSPDGDGRDDYLLIGYQLPEPGYVANVRVFNSNGIEIYRIANNITLGTSGQLRWDGIDTQNRRVGSGIYIISIEYFNLSGRVYREKKTCVVGYR